VCAQELEKKEFPGTDPREVHSRSDLVEYLSQSMRAEYIDIVGDDEIRQPTTFVKSYLVERHHPNGDELQQRLKRAFGTVHERNDRSMLLLFDRFNEPYFADIAHKRFIIVHSIAPTKATDQTLERFTTQVGAGFDRSWMPTQFLENTWRGHLTGFKFKFDQQVEGTAEPGLEPVQADQSWARIASRARFRMNVSEDFTAQSDFNSIRESNIFSGRAALEQVQFQVIDVDSKTFVVNGVYSNGKIIGRGTSIAGHISNVVHVMDTYDMFLQQIESFALGWVEEDQRVEYKGEPLVILFPQTINILDLMEFAKSVFRPQRPFRLMGFADLASEDRIDLKVVDLHTSDQFAVELTHEWLRIYLPRGACGNTVARLFVNLQHSFHADIRLLSGGGELLGEGLAYQ
jgi:hypothetical protein